MHEDGGGRLVLGWLAVIRPIAFTIAWIVAEVSRKGIAPGGYQRAGRAVPVDHDYWVYAARRRTLHRSGAAGIRDGTAAMYRDCRRAVDPTFPHPAKRPCSLSPTGTVVALRCHARRGTLPSAHRVAGSARVVMNGHAFRVSRSPVLAARAWRLQLRCPEHRVLG